MSTTPTPVTPEVPPGKDAVMGLNLKLGYDETLKDLAELRDNHEKLALEILADAHAAANTHLLNIIDAAQKLSQATALNLATLGAQAVQQQGITGALSADDLAKITQAVTAAVSATLANMATGRPVVSVPGAVEAPVSK